MITKQDITRICNEHKIPLRYGDNKTEFDSCINKILNEILNDFEIAISDHVEDMWDKTQLFEYVIQQKQSLK